MNGRPLPARPAYLSFLPRFLFTTDRVRARYIVKAWLVALLPSLILSILVGLLAPAAERPTFQLEGAMLPITVLLLVLIGPLVETLLMIAPLLLLNRFVGAGPAVVGSALLWGAAHSLVTPAWGLVTWWPFLILSIAFLTWRERGIATAILMVTAIHGLQNSVVAVALLMAAAQN